MLGSYWILLVISWALNQPCWSCGLNVIGFMDIYGYLSSDYSRNLMDDDDEAVKRIGSGFIWHLWRLNQLKDWNISITQHKCDKWYQMISNDGWVGNLMWVYGIKSISHVGCDVFSSYPAMLWTGGYGYVWTVWINENYGCLDCYKILTGIASKPQTCSPFTCSSSIGDPMMDCHEFLEMTNPSPFYRHRLGRRGCAHLDQNRWLL